MVFLAHQLPQGTLLKNGEEMKNDSEQLEKIRSY